MQTLRPYQAAALEDLRAELRAGRRRLLLVAPTGSGKTTIAAHMIHGAVERRRHVLFLAHRTELIKQCSARLWEHDIFHGCIKADMPSRAAYVQIASVQTLVRRMPPPADLIIIDEAHRARAESYLQILGHYPEAAVIGLTATPWRLDGRGLGDIFDALVEVTTVEQLIGDGYLVRPRIFAPAGPDLAGVKTARGDYDERGLSLVVDRPKLIGDLVEHWARHACGRKTVVFATGVTHSHHLADAFSAAGVRSAHVDGTTPEGERASMLARLDVGDLELVSNVGILGEGWDLPALGAAVLARPTQSLAMHLQQVGRVMRPHREKDGAVVLDHAGNTHRHGLPWDPHDMTLSSSRRKRSQEATAPSVRTCPNCFAVALAGATACPECGAAYPVQASIGIRTENGDLVELTGGITRRVTLELIEQRREYHRLRQVADRKGYQRGWIAHQFREKFNSWPTREVMA